MGKARRYAVSAGRRLPTLSSCGADETALYRVPVVYAPCSPDGAARTDSVGSNPASARGLNFHGGVRTEQGGISCELPLEPRANTAADSADEDGAPKNTGKISLYFSRSTGRFSPYLPELEEAYSLKAADQAVGKAFSTGCVSFQPRVGRRQVYITELWGGIPCIS